MRPKQRKITWIHLDPDIDYDFWVNTQRKIVIPYLPFGDNLSVPTSRLKKFKQIAFFWGGGDRGVTVAKVLCYKSEGRWFDPS